MSKIFLDKEAYKNNLNIITKKVGSKDRVILVLKANAYGHGARVVATVAKELGFSFCAVKNEREACELQDLMEHILILSHVFDGNENDKFIYAINSIHGLKKAKKGTKVHLNIDTLMHRNGVTLDEISSAIKLINERNLQLLGAFTHFRAADELNADYFVQKQNFKMAKEVIRSLYDAELVFHSHASAAFERNTSGFDGEYVRVGIAQFGYPQFVDDFGLRPVLSLWARRISARTLKAGQSIGYNAKFTATRDMEVATYDVGYSEGLLRYNGVGELRLANGEMILGRMSMDSFSSVNAGEWVCVFDDAKSWAKFFNTIEYEILVKLSAFIKREWK